MRFGDPSPAFWILGSGFWVLGFGFWVLGSGFRVQGSGHKGHISQSRVERYGSKDQNAGSIDKYVIISYVGSWRVFFLCDGGYWRSARPPRGRAGSF